MTFTTTAGQAANRRIRSTGGAVIAALAALLVAAVFPVAPALARTQTALIAVAANFAAPAKALADRFTAETGHSLKISTGSTGQLYAQITNGAPYDVFLSADAERPRKLEDNGLAVAGSRFTYAVGRLVLWSPSADAEAGPFEAAFSNQPHRSIAIANPDLAPYGAAAREALRSKGLWDDLKGQLVFGQNISQTHALVATGNAEIGFVAQSQIKNSSPKGARWPVPAESHSPISQDAVLLARARDNTAARAFVSYLQGAGAKKIIEEFGYESGGG
jgi:molybdate transport system substrate-binding protein